MSCEAKESFCAECVRYTKDVDNPVWISCGRCGEIKRFKDEVKSVRKGG